MKYPNFREEKRLWKKGYNVVVGIDEVGRGSLAGPVVAVAACFIFPESAEKFPLRVLDSKQLSSKKRKEICRALNSEPGVEWGIGRAYQKAIDRINILEATKLAMERAVFCLNKKLRNNFQKKFLRKKNKIGDLIDFLLIDGNFEINSDIPQKSVIRADEKIFSVALASIIAKVKRDRTMLRYCKKYPQYFFDENKGYPTKAHRKMIKKYGPSPIHRRTFHFT